MAQQYTVWEAQADGTRTPAGEMFLDDHGRLMVLAAEPAFDDLLENIAAEINGSEEVALREPPRPGDERFSRRQRLVERAEPDFAAAVADTLHRSYGFVLEARA